MHMTHPPSRQVHLDFHTSEHIPGVGRRFDKKQWQKALKLGHVNSINIFAKCHHGWSYYPTKIGKRHPTLKRDLLGKQIEACHEIGVKCPIYFTVGWSVHDAETHPEWCVHDQHGRPVGPNVDPGAMPETPRPFVSWIHLCPSGDYLKLMLAQTEEICRRYPRADGLWYDITGGPTCYCKSCRRGMHAEGIDIEDETAVAAYGVRKWKHFYAESRRIVESHLKDPVVYYNGTTSAHGMNRMWEHNTQNDLEDLPTTWGGYNRFPLRARYFAKAGVPYVAMSGKFHTSWGEFGGFKHPDALRFEAAAMIAYGAHCNFGDQLHPSGEMDLSTYRNIGKAFRYVRKIEKYGPGGKPCASLGVWWGNDRATSTGPFAAEPNHRGIADMLLESQIDFELVDEDDDLSRFRAIIVTAACLDKKQAATVEAFRKGGGKLLILGEGGLDAATRSRFILNVGATYAGPPSYRTDYLVAGGRLGRQLVASPFFNCSAALRARVTSGKTLSAVQEPYFDRTYAKYCSHRNTPYRLEQARHPAAWAGKDFVYLAHPVGQMYITEGARLHRQYFLNALRMVYPAGKQTLAVTMPSEGRVSLVHQPGKKRYVAHLLYGPPIPRNGCQVIEDLVPLFDIPVRLNVPENIRRASLPLEKKTLKMKTVNHAVEVVVPRVQCHQMAVFEY